MKEPIVVENNCKVSVYVTGIKNEDIPRYIDACIEKYREVRPASLEFKIKVLLWDTDRGDILPDGAICLYE